MKKYLDRYHIVLAPVYPGHDMRYPPIENVAYDLTIYVNESDNTKIDINNKGFALRLFANLALFVLHYNDIVFSCDDKKRLLQYCRFFNNNGFKVVKNEVSALVTRH